MSEDPKKKLRSAAQDIDLGLNGLFGALSDAIGDMVSRLEEGNSGAVARDHVFETDKGQIRAHAGVRLQMGGMDIGRGGGAATPKPVNPYRDKPMPAEKTAKLLEYDVFEEAEAWIFTADLPGVARDQLSLTQDGTCLKLLTIGARLFEASVELGKSFDFEGIETRLNNGVLTLKIAKKGKAE